MLSLRSGDKACETGKLANTNRLVHLEFSLRAKIDHKSCPGIDEWDDGEILDFI
jgi:hypothetical protein